MGKAKHFAVGALFCALAMFGLTACGGNMPSVPDQPGDNDVVEPVEYTSAAEVIEANKANNSDNYTLNGAIGMVVDVKADGELLNMPITLAYEDFDFAGDYGHGTMRMSLEAMDESEELSIEVYLDASDSSPGVYASEDGTNWTKSSISSSSQYLPTFATEIDEDLLSAGKFAKTADGYTVTIDMGKWMKESAAADLLSEFSSVTEDVVDTDAIMKALEETSITYTFDDDCNLTSLAMEDFAYETTVDTGYMTADLSLTMGIDFEFSNYGKVKSSSVRVPASVVESATAVSYDGNG